LTRKSVRSWRYWLSQILGLALFGLAALQAGTSPASVTRGQLAIGVATKVITGVIAILVVRVVQDMADRVDELRQQDDDEG
jgi:hypothetical protein